MTKIGSPKTASEQKIDRAPKTQAPSAPFTGSPSALDRAIACLITTGALGLMASLLMLKGGVQ